MTVTVTVTVTLTVTVTITMTMTITITINYHDCYHRRGPDVGGALRGRAGARRGRQARPSTFMNNRHA